MRVVPVLVLLVLVGATPARATPPNEPLPPDAVAVVGDAVITPATFDLWLGAAARDRTEVLDPPGFKRCVDAKLRRGAHPHLQADRERLHRRCARDYRLAKREVMQFLIQAEWVGAEAAIQGIRVTEAQVRRSFERQKREAFPTERAYQRFLRGSGMTEEMILVRVRLDLLQRRLSAGAARDIRPTRNRRLRARREARAIARFVAEFRQRWLMQTVCAPGYVVAECGLN